MARTKRRLIFKRLGQSLIRNFWQRTKRRLHFAPREHAGMPLMKFCRLLIVAAICLPFASISAAQTPDSEYEAVAEDYIKGYLAARPLLGTALGLHVYDGKITDYTPLAI